MEVKVRGAIVLFDALEIKGKSSLILGNEDKEYKLVVTYVGNLVEGIEVGDEIVLRNDGAKEVVQINKHIHWLTAATNVLAVIEGNDVETYDYEQTIERQKNAPVNMKQGIELPHTQDLILPKN